MTWTFSQSTGKLAENGVYAGTGYSGNGAGFNNAAMQNVPDVGPLPQGTYTIGPFADDPVVGLFAAALTPAPENEMYGRAGFFIHGMDEEDAVDGTHTSSHGCIVLGRPIRQMVADSGDAELEVVP